GQAVLACAPEHVERFGVTAPCAGPSWELGVVGGDRLLGIPVGELAEAWA
nr:hypothetical protein [Actinomycetota bacterium]